MDLQRSLCGSMFWSLKHPWNYFFVKSLIGTVSFSPFEGWPLPIIIGKSVTLQISGCNLLSVVTLWSCTTFVQSLHISVLIYKIVRLHMTLYDGLIWRHCCTRQLHNLVTASYDSVARFLFHVTTRPAITTIGDPFVFLVTPFCSNDAQLLQHLWTAELGRALLCSSLLTPRLLTTATPLLLYFLYLIFEVLACRPPGFLSANPFSYLHFNFSCCFLGTHTLYASGLADLIDGRACHPDLVAHVWLYARCRNFFFPFFFATCNCVQWTLSTTALPTCPLVVWLLYVWFLQTLAPVWICATRD